ncbi:MAG: alpha/beta hydrolase [Marinovum sp.]|nr:alpha/beta hydrolase [Marinovum sp.]
MENDDWIDGFEIFTWSVTVVFWALVAFLAICLLVVILVVLWEIGRKAVGVRRSKAEGHILGLPQGATHVIEDGPSDGPPIILVHGLTTPAFVFDALVPDLVARGHRVIRYDHYGRGYSDRPKGLQTASFFRTHLNAIYKASNIECPAILVGYSMGGAIVADFAAMHPDKVKSAYLIAPAGMRTDLGGVLRRAATWPVIGDFLMHMFFPRMHRKGTDAERVLNVQVPRIIERQQEELEYRGFVRSVLSSLRGILAHDLAPEHRRLATLELPVTVIWAEQDQVIPLEGKRQLEKWNPAARHVVVPEAGHGVTYTHPQAVLDAISD